MLVANHGNLWWLGFKARDHTALCALSAVLQSLLLCVRKLQSGLAQMWYCVCSPWNLESPSCQGLLRHQAYIDVLQGLLFAFLFSISYSSSALLTVSSCVYAAP